VQEKRDRVRRKYKLNPKKRRVNFGPGEEDHLKSICVILKIAGYSHKDIAASIGITRGQVGDWLKEENTQKLYLATLDAIPSAAKELLQTYSIEAVHAIADVMRSSEDDKMVLEAAKDILDRSGLPKASRAEVEKSETHKFQMGVDHEQVATLRDLPPHMQEAAAQMIEDLETNLKEMVEKGGENASGD
jgi:transposase